MPYPNQTGCVKPRVEVELKSSWHFQHSVQLAPHGSVVCGAYEIFASSWRLIGGGMSRPPPPHHNRFPNSEEIGIQQHGDIRLSSRASRLWPACRCGGLEVFTRWVRTAKCEAFAIVPGEASYMVSGRLFSFGYIFWVGEQAEHSAFHRPCRFRRLLECLLHKLHLFVVISSV